VLRAAGEDDAATIRRWRNHPKVRAASLTTHEIGAAEHRAWWQAVSTDLSRQVLIYERAGRPVGVVVFTGLGGPVAEWSKYLDVAGIGTERRAAWIDLEHEALRYAFEVLGVTRLRGVTLATNRPVLALHAEVGFTETRRFEREGREIVWNELTATEWTSTIRNRPTGRTSPR
jgi:UDP-4-amino-4,6-dideoxy-N-acetyl-beta-L-altrosamine N-acetyltransferase